MATNAEAKRGIALWWDGGGGTNISTFLLSKKRSVAAISELIPVVTISGQLSVVTV